MKQYAVIGIGRFGRAVATELAQSGQEVLAVDRDEEKIADIEPYVTHAIQAQIVDEADFEDLGLRNFDVVIIALGHDLPASVMLCMLAKEAGVPLVVAKVSEPLHEKILQRVGADQVIFPENDMGIRTAHKLLSSNVIDLIELSSQHSILNMKTPKIWVGKSLGELLVRTKLGMNVVAIRSGDDVISIPGPQYVLADGDIMVMIGKNEDIAKIERKYE